MRIAFAGTPAFAVPALDALASSGHQLIGVLTQPDRPAGRGRHATASAVKLRALELGLPLAQPEQLRTDEQRAALRDWQPELLVVVAYGLILPQAALDLPRLGCLNIHASLLPRWRGAAPIQRAILAGDRETGVCIMQLEAGLDTGPVFLQRRVAIDDQLTAGELQTILAEQGATALLATLAGIEAGTMRAQPQGSEGVSHASKIDKREAVIDWTASAVQIARQVRAFNPWPVAETRVGEVQLRIWRATAMPDVGSVVSPGTLLGLHDGKLRVACGSGVLDVESLQLAGRRVNSATDFVNAMRPAAARFA